MKRVLYNKNIILNILNSTFGDEIEEYIQNCVVEMDSNELKEYFEQETDYAVLDVLEQMVVQDFEVELDEENKELISGTLEISAEIDGYVHWEGEEIYIESAAVTIGLLYEFHAENEQYTDLYLEYLY